MVYQLFRNKDKNIQIGLNTIISVLRLEKGGVVFLAINDQTDMEKMTTQLLKLNNMQMACNLLMYHPFTCKFFSEG